jgi:cytochrome c oxidase subunit 2
LKAMSRCILAATALTIGASATGDEASRREFEVTAARFRFEPASLEVTEGDRIALTLRSADGTHGFAIPDFQVKATIPKGGSPVTVEFVAAKAGTFKFECSEYCGSGHRQMKGRLVVAARAR